MRVLTARSDAGAVASCERTIVEHRVYGLLLNGWNTTYLVSLLLDFSQQLTQQAFVLFAEMHTLQAPPDTRQPLSSSLLSAPGVIVQQASLNRFSVPSSAINRQRQLSCTKGGVGLFAD